MKKKVVKKTKPIITKKKKKRRSKRPDYKLKIEIDQILLHNRNLFLSGVIDTEKAFEITTRMIALDAYSPKTPIFLWINSPGGSVYDGFSIIDCMTGLSSPVFTIINGHAASMGGIISIYGDRRYMCKNSTWMAHDVYSGTSDYVTKSEYRFENSKRLQSKLIKMLREETKLTEKDIEIARHGELWLDAKECKKKGIIEEILN